MTGFDLLADGAAGAAAVLLLIAGAGHARHRRLFAATLAAQKTLPLRVRGPVALVMGPLELALGAALVGGLLVGGPTLRPAALAAAALYLGFGGYVAVVWRTRPAVPCGCFGSSGPASGWTVARAVVLGLACLLVGTEARAASGTDAVVVAGGALVLTGVFWLLPELTHLGR